MKKTFLHKVYLSASISLLCFLQHASFGQGQIWLKDVIPDTSDMRMMDIRWPWWGQSTYNAFWNNILWTPDRPGIYSFYGGHATGNVPVLANLKPNLDMAIQDGVRPQGVWTFWGHSAQGQNPQIVASSPYAYPVINQIEGAGTGLQGNVWSMIKRGKWYTQLTKIWHPIDPNANYTYIGRWMKDVEANHWNLYGIVKIFDNVAGFLPDNGVFLEDYANYGVSASGMDRRFGYSRNSQTGTWSNADMVTLHQEQYTRIYDGYWHIAVLPEGDHEYFSSELSSNPEVVPVLLQDTVSAEPNHLQVFRHKQPCLPTLDTLKIKNANAQSNGNQVVVSWALDSISAPQLAYMVEVFDNPLCQGNPLAASQDRMPVTNMILLDAAVANPTVRITLTDVFDRQSQPVIVNAVQAGPAVAADNSNNKEIGIDYSLYHRASPYSKNYLYPPCNTCPENAAETHYYLSVNEIAATSLVRQGVAPAPHMDLLKESLTEGYGYHFNGYLRVPNDGFYLMHVLGADGYRIRIDEDSLLFDGPHGPQEKVFALNLLKGDHLLALDYFVDITPRPSFSIQWEGGTNLPLQAIPDSVFYHNIVANKPSGGLTVTKNADATYSLQASVTPNGHQVDSIEIILNNQILVTSGGGGNAAYNGILPVGANTLFIKIFYDGNQLITSESQAVNVDLNNPLTGWKTGIAGDATKPYSIVQTAPDAFSFIGTGEFVVYNDIAGDYTLTCKIEHYAGENGESVDPGDWVGLTARDYADKTSPNWGNEFGIYQLAGRVLPSPNWGDYGAERLAAWPPTLVQSPWLRIVRHHNNAFSAFTSPDGVTWTLMTTNYIPFASNSAGTGVVFRVLPGATGTYTASVSNLKLEQGVPSNLESLLAPIAATNTSGDRLTGVVMAASNPNVVVVRSTTGLLRSSDGGTSWSPINNGLSGAANQVRSVAIDPTNPNIIYRATSGGLYKTMDGGSTWQALNNFTGDFDGTGPSALCGEVLAIDPNNPLTVFAGSETKGFFKSSDGGATWKYIDMAGKRITAVTPQLFALVNGSFFAHVVTSADSWMSLLGRGNPSSVLSDVNSYDYITVNGGESLQMQTQRSDIGFFSCSLTRSALYEANYGSSAGLWRNYGSSYFWYPPVENVETFRPITAQFTTALVDTRTVNSRTILGPLNPSNPARISEGMITDFANIENGWSFQYFSGDIPTEGMISVCGELTQGQEWWLLSTDGLYHSTNAGATLQKVLNHLGQ